MTKYPIRTVATLILLSQLCFVGMSVLGVDISQLFSVSTYQCMKNNGVRFAIPRGYCSFGGVDSHVKENLANAKSAGLITDIYMFPCRSKDPSTQVSQMMSAISGSLYGMVWIDVETNPSPGCSWSGHSGSSNCDYVNQIAAAIKKNGKNVGIYASSYMWQTIMGSTGACTSANAHQLWYAHYDGSASFSDYKQIGGWSKPSIKQYKGDTTLCGAGVDLNYYP